MSPHSGRNATAQAGFPKGRVGWLIGAILLAILIAAVVIVRGPWGPPISKFGAGARTAALLLVAAVPIGALAWAWKRLPRWGRRVAPMPLGVLSLMLALLAFAQAKVFAERVRMGRDPATVAAANLARGDTLFWAVEDSVGNLLAPPLVNRCIINRYETRITPGTDGMTMNARHARYRRRATERARRHNELVIARLGIPAEEVRRQTDAFCPD
ncbi:MAG: hypothetical protein KY467_11625 [Gemmatimonadetes bacterium]|nr:hypothetical protein [Gemmatimonadota bacterium]